MTKEEKLQKIKQTVGVTMTNIPRDQKQVETGIMIGNVLQWITSDREGRNFNDVGDLVSIRFNTDEPLDKQDDKCVDFIFDLVSDI
jgi:hypothetical protein